jgi:hypothetical protein
MKITRQEIQSIFDIAIHHCGDAQAAFNIARINGISLTDDSTTVIEILQPQNKRVVNYYTNNQIVPVTDAKWAASNVITYSNEPIITHQNEIIIYEQEI